MPDQLPHALRSDARDNRELILEAARAAFTAQGPNVPMREIARRAGVGPATVYRRFPTKETLAAAALGDQLRSCYTVIDEAAADPDPWRAFRLVIERLFALNAGNRDLAAAFTAAFPRALDYTGESERALKSLADLARRAKDAGHLRRDFVLDDLLLMLLANRGLPLAPAARAAASRRLAALAIQAFQSAPAAADSEQHAETA